ncbi:uncharacterized protein EV422DRAFT_253579 [Fimicolochytrium jonesii]|uniref:uncharacterized protein n=1 Tax=Fimicolochytrium jonesii TaxID=1396493 RepID=UPI0022FF3CE5|nr:uncharacterized protein EV422DRAFT_253579 [Fimicolochytrium jonesii]KAI8825284.1 hypothetical protein EV422DRAFT_253579 [Fimicolochytrium jonesii]
MYRCSAPDHHDLHARIKLCPTPLPENGSHQMAGSVHNLPAGLRQFEKTVLDPVFLVQVDGNTESSAVIGLGDVLAAVNGGLRKLDNSLSGVPSHTTMEELIYVWDLLTGPMHGFHLLAILADYRAVDPWTKIATRNALFVDAKLGLLQYVVDVNLVTVVSSDLDPQEIERRLEFGEELSLESGRMIKDILIESPVQKVHTSDFVVDWDD